MTRPAPQPVLLQRTAHKKLDELLELEVGLTTWEADFVEAMDKRRRGVKPTPESHNFTFGEIAKIDQIHDERVEP